MCVAGVHCVHGGVHVSWGCPSSSNEALSLVKKGGLDITTVQILVQPFFV